MGSTALTVHWEEVGRTSIVLCAGTAAIVSAPPSWLNDLFNYSAAGPLKAVPRPTATMDLITQPRTNSLKRLCLRRHHHLVLGSACVNYIGPSTRLIV